MNVSNIIQQMLSESSCHGHLLYNINTATKYRYFCYVAIMMYDIIVCYITNYCVQVIQHIPGWPGILTLGAGRQVPTWQAESRCSDASVMMIISCPDSDGTAVTVVTRMPGDTLRLVQAWPSGAAAGCPPGHGPGPGNCRRSR